MYDISFKLCAVNDFPLIRRSGPAGTVPTIVKEEVEDETARLVDEESRQAGYGAAEETTEQRRAR